MSPMSPMSPGYEDCEPPLIVDASPPRGRQRPIIHDVGRRPRSASIEVHISTSRQERPRSRSRSHSRSSRRSPSPLSYEERQREQRLEEDRERRRRRDRREARLVAEIEVERERRRLEEFRVLHDAEINARPPVPAPTLPLRPRSILRPVVEQTGHRNSVLEDMRLSSRGERVIADAIAERERAEERERLLKAGLEAEEEEARRERLKRRFTVSGGGGTGPSGRRNRVEYDDGTYRWVP